VLGLGWLRGHLVVEHLTRLDRFLDGGNLEARLKVFRHVIHT
jgi:hypothetical protein